MRGRFERVANGNADMAVFQAHAHTTSLPHQPPAPAEQMPASRLARKAVAHAWARVLERRSLRADLAFDDQGAITGVKAEHQLTNDANVNWGPFWHPDDKHIIYATSKHGPANYQLYLIRDDGSHPVRITHNPGLDILPAFSPDGKYLMWTSKRSPDHTAQVFVARFTMPEGS